jgi:sec-independent protein translocase protein TatB
LPKARPSGSFGPVFGFSFTELALTAVVALLVVGPKKLPQMLRTLGTWVRKIRKMTTEVRAQTGIDDILKQEGLEGGIAELRSLVRGDLVALARERRAAADVPDDPYPEAIELDRTREYPPEGADAAGALPDDLVDDPAPEPPPELPPPAPEPPLTEASRVDDASER